MAGELKFIPGYNPEAGKKLETDRDKMEFWKDEEAKTMAYNKNKEELRARTAETAKLKKEISGSVDFKISPETEEVREFMRENFNASLEAIEKDLAGVVRLAGELKNDSSDELKVHIYGMKIDSMSARLQSLQEIYKKDEFPEMLGRLKDAFTMFDSLKANYRFEDKKRA